MSVRLGEHRGQSALIARSTDPCLLPTPAQCLCLPLCESHCHISLPACPVPAARFPDLFSRPTCKRSGDPGFERTMQYRNVCLEVASPIPCPRRSSPPVRSKPALEPLYRRLRLPEGRLELMTGIRQRRFWPARHAAQREQRRDRAEKAICAGRARQAATSAC